jgi:hypothetical protein
MTEHCDQQDSLLTNLTSDLLSKNRVQYEGSRDEWLETPEAKQAKWAMLGQNIVWVAGADGGQKIVPANVWPYAETELARPYLTACLDNAGSKGIKWRKDDLPLFSQRVPGFFERPFRGDLAHVDIDHAYWQLFARWSLDADYKPGRYFSLGKVKFLETEHIAGRHRELRMAVGGIIRSRQYHALRYGEVITMPARPGLQAPRLWGLTMHCLNAIAADAVRDFGCLYWHTDGGVVPGDRADAFRQYLLDVWGLTSHSVRDGEGWLRKFASYKVGSLIKGMHTTPNLTSNIPARPVRALIDLDRACRRVLFRAAEG